MKIYTKRGDAGQTDLLTKRIDKTHLRIDVNGSFDESMAHILMLKHFINDASLKKDMDRIHQILFDVCYEIALDDTSKPITTKDDVLWVEQQIDRFDQSLERLTKFIRLDKNQASSWANMVRVTIRRAERRLIELSKQDPINAHTLEVVNRLSDYFFTLGRFLEV
ncbi:MAG: cob(I)yrinic acid a,c-diamide adenosyltransferase [Acholeplasmataceae bacterium]